MERAATDGEAGESIRAVAKDRNVDRSTLRRDIKRREEVKTGGTEEQQRKEGLHRREKGLQTRSKNC